jgi:hypothetical protein
MNINVGQAEIGQWLGHVDKGELLQVVGHDDQSHAIELQSFDGYVDEIDDETWNTLPLERSAPPQDWTAPMDDLETDDLAARKPRCPRWIGCSRCGWTARVGRKPSLRKNAIPRMRADLRNFSA